MPAKRKTKADRQREQFGKMLAVGKAVTHLTDEDVAECCGISIPTLWRRKEDPSKLTVGELTKLTAIMGWDTEDIVKLIVQ